METLTCVSYFEGLVRKCGAYTLLLNGAAALQGQMRLKLAPPTAAAAAGRSPGWKHGLRCSDHAQTEAPRGAGRTQARTHARTRRDLRQDGGNDRPDFLSHFYGKN